MSERRDMSVLRVIGGAARGKAASGVRFPFWSNPDLRVCRVGYRSCLVLRAVPGLPVPNQPRERWALLVRLKRPHDGVNLAGTTAPCGCSKRTRASGYVREGRLAGVSMRPQRVPRW